MPYRSAQLGPSIRYTVLLNEDALPPELRKAITTSAGDPNTYLVAWDYLSERGVRLLHPSDLDKHTLKTWNQRRWHEPSRSAAGWAIWYGPGGYRQADNAVTVEYEGNGFAVREYQRLIDDDGRFLQTGTFISVDALTTALQVAGHGVNVERVAAYPDRFKRWVAGLGVAKLAHWGGTEDTVMELPDW